MARILNILLPSKASFSFLFHYDFPSKNLIESDCKQVISDQFVELLSYFWQDQHLH